MLMAGVLLFVSARWEDFSPTLRMTLLVSAMGGFHVVAAFCAERFPRDGDHDARYDRRSSASSPSQHRAGPSRPSLNHTGDIPAGFIGSDHAGRHD